MSRLLTDEERALPQAEKRALRKARRHAKWGGPRPPWVDDALDVLESVARDAVRMAAKSVIRGGRARHDAAVAHVMRTAPDGISGKVASALVWRAFQTLADAGEIDE